jgi:MFS family permease
MTGVALRPLSVGEIIDASFQVYRRYFGALAMVVLICNSIPLLLQIFVEASGGPRDHPILAISYSLMFLVLGSVATAATVFIVSESYLGRAITARDALNLAAPFVGRVITTSILVGLMVGGGIVILVVVPALVARPLAIVGFLALLVFGIVGVCGFVVTTPALVLEGLPTAPAALRRSWTLTRGYRLKILGLLFLLGVIMMLPWMAVTGLAAILGALAAVGGGGARVAVLVGVVGIVLGGLVLFLLQPLLHAVLTISYYDLRVRKEGFDLEVLASSLHAA